MMALERKATLVETAQRELVEVYAQPFGGAVRILDVQALQDLIGTFHFDSVRSRFERDFRLFIRPFSWPTLRAVCIEHLGRDHDPVLDSHPGRELVEEFFDVLGIKLLPAQYTCRSIGMVAEDNPHATHNPRARGYPTVRIYRVFEARITDPALAQALIANSEGVTDQALREQALREAQSGGRGRANAVLALQLEPIMIFFRELSPQERSHPVIFDGHQLDETVAEVLEGVCVPKYQRM